MPKKARKSPSGGQDLQQGRDDQVSMAHTPQARPLAGVVLVILALAITAAMVSITVAGEPRVGILAGRVVDSQGEPIAGAYVTVPASGEDETRDVLTDESGHWRAPGVPIGYHEITAQRRGYSRGSQQSGSLSEGRVLQVESIVLSPRPDELSVEMFWDQSVLPGERKRFYLNGSSAQPEVKVTFSIYPYDLAAEQTSPRRDGVSFREQFLSSLSGSEAPVWTWERTYSTDARDGMFHAEPRTPALDRPGAYMVVAQVGDLRAAQPVNVTELSLVVKRHFGGTLVWCVNSESGEPAPGASVELYSQGSLFESGASDRDGLFRAGNPGGEQAVVAARRHGSLALSQCYYYTDSFRQDSLIYTDRPIYRPGHTIYFKGIFRRQKPGGFTVAANRPIQFVIQDPEGQQVAAIGATTTAIGTADGSWTSGEDARVGRYSVIANLDGARYEAGFQVEEYRKPEYAASVTIKKSYHVSGEPIKATVRSNYYFGAPVAGAEVSYVVYSSPYYYPDYEDEFVSWFKDEEGYGYDYGGYGEVVREGRGATDENGELQIEIGTAGIEEQARWTIEAHVVDASMREVQARAGTLVVPAAFHVQVSPQRYVVMPGEEALFDIKTADWDRKPVGNKTLDAVIERVRWARGREILSPVTTASITTGADGRKVLRWKADTEGAIRVTLSGKDQAGRVARGSTDLWVARDSYEGWEDVRPEGDLTVVPDKKVYRKGDTARLLVTTTAKNPVLLVTAEGQRLFGARVVRTTGSGYMLEFPVLAEHLPNVNVVCTLISRDSMLSQETPITVSPEQSLLTVKVDAAKKRYRPGETAHYTIQTVDSSGLGVPAEVSLGVVDESIYALRNDTTPDIQKHFWGPRGNDVRTSFSGEGYYYGGLDKFETKVRRYFPDTAYWNPYIRTDSLGIAHVAVRMPDSLTTWRATARAVTSATQVGEATGKVTVTKDLIVRLQTPRFFRERDRQTLGVIVHNYTGQPKRVTVRLTARGLALKSGAVQVATIPSDGTVKLAYPIEARDSGQATILAEALAEDRSATDAVELAFAVFPHGARSSVLASGRASPEGGASMAMDSEGKLEGAALQIELTPSQAGAVVQGLQYLAGYPWGCVEQITSSFVPDVLVKRASERVGLVLPESLKKDLPKMIAQGIRKLREMQHADGSWGWYYEADADLAMTAYVLTGLVEARVAGANIPQDMVARAASWIREHTAQPLPPRPAPRDWRKAGDTYLGVLEARAYALMAAAATGAGDQARFAPLYDRRDELTNTALACLGLAAWDAGHRAEFGQIVRLLEKRQTRNSGLAFWRASKTRYYFSDAGASALALRVLTRAGRPPEQLEPVTRWLAAKRHGGYWENTRDSALVVLALLEHIERIAPASCTASVTVNGRPVKTVSLTKEDYLRPPKRLVIGPAQLRRGTNNIVIAKSGSAPLYFTGVLTYVSAAEDVPAKPGYFSVDRTFGKLQIVKGPGDGYEEKVTPLKGAVRAGEVLRVQVRVRASGEASYVLIDSPLPSGFEVVNRDREWSWRFSGVQVRDERIGLFSRTLPGGLTVMEYDVRAEVPGDLHVMPTRVSAMYSPALFGSSAEERLTVR